MRQDVNLLSNPLTFPLFGSRLIEASAGTGKTYTIAALYVRLVLQHGKEALAFNRELLPKDILVMTFTRAATAELADRIRARLSEAASYFRAEDMQHADAFLTHLKADYLQQGADPATLSRLAKRLELAAESMDESAVYTINGWCQKMLTEHAFASGSLFEQHVETDEDELKLAAAEDYFRRFVYPLSTENAEPILTLFGTPQALVKKMGRVAPDTRKATTDYLSLAASREQALQQAVTEVAQLKAKYRPAQEVLTLILALPDKNNGGRKNAANILQQWLDSDQISFDLGNDKKYFTLEKLNITFGNSLPPEALVLLEAEADMALTKAIAKRADSAMLQHASGYIYARFTELKQDAAQLGFDDMLTRLRDALTGRNGPQLAETIRQQFPVALVDEFQDTDPVQYHIFDTIYRVADNDPTTGIFLIGDPKQAIYSFRNADIFTYLKARQATAGRHYNLATNFRSSQSMVDAVNRLFQLADAEFKRGAFLYKEDIPFVEVAANGQSRVFKGLTGQEEAALQWQVATEPAANKEAYQKTAARYQADLITQLLNSEQAGFYAGDVRQAVQPKDIAVLVANANEARLIRRELTQRGIRSVYLSESDAVYAQPVAADLLALLQACAQPRDPGRIRTALAVPLLALPLSELVNYQENELAWEAAVERFIGYHNIWGKLGVLAALLRILHDFHVPGRLLADPRQGERQLADAMHLCELLQQESMRLEGMANLEEFFARQVQEYQGSAPNETSGKRTSSDALQLRLESDQDLVKVITYHKSKGLQYPLVFMPFPAYTTEQQYRFKEYKFPIRYHQRHSNNERIAQIAWSAGDQEAMPAILEEMLAEDLRKMYVALTRAEFATFVTLQAVGDPKHNPMFYLLYGDAELSNKQTDVLAQARARWQPSAVTHTAVSRLTTTATEYLQAENSKANQLQARTFAGNFQQNAWWITSYSALNYGSELLTPDTPQQMNLLEAVRDESEQMPAQYAQTPSLLPEGSLEPAATTADRADPATVRIHHLPKGATLGTFLHNLLEDAAALGFASVAHDENKRNELLALHCNGTLWQPYRTELAPWLAEYLQVGFTLPTGTVALAELTSYRAEPEFWFETQRVSTQRLDQLIAQYIQPGYARPKLDTLQLNGMLKGFIDLVFEHQGKYYVADYKSNWLGDHDEAYSTEQMRQKILASRYDLQYVIYTFALHKLLKARLGKEYDYDRHVGGALYLFLRGHAASSRGAFFERPPRQLIEALDAALLSQQAEGAANV